MLLGLNARPVKRLSGFLADGNLGGLAALAADVDAGSKVVIVDAYTVDIVVLDGGIAIVVYRYIRDAGRCRAAEDAEVVKHHGIALGAGESDGDIYVFAEILTERNTIVEARFLGQRYAGEAIVPADV